MRVDDWYRCKECSERVRKAAEAAPPTNLSVKMECVLRGLPEEGKMDFQAWNPSFPTTNALLKRGLIVRERRFVRLSGKGKEWRRRDREEDQGRIHKAIWEKEGDGDVGECKG